MNQSDVGHVFRFWSARATIRNVAAARKCGEPTAICGLWARCCRTVGQRCRTTTRKSCRPKIEALCYHGNCVNGRGARKIDKSLLGFRSAGKLLQYFLNNIKRRKRKKEKKMLGLSLAIQRDIHRRGSNWGRGSFLLSSSCGICRYKHHRSRRKVFHDKLTQWQAAIDTVMRAFEMIKEIVILNWGLDLF